MEAATGSANNLPEWANSPSVNRDADLLVQDSGEQKRHNNESESMQNGHEK